MKIKVDMKSLKEQIAICDTFANMQKGNIVGGMFEGIANFLGEIEYALTYDKEIEFEEKE